MLIECDELQNYFALKVICRVVLSSRIVRNIYVLIVLEESKQPAVVINI